MMTSEAIRTRISNDAAQLNLLHERVHSTLAIRDQDSAAWHAWLEAAQELRDRYDLLAFPGGETTMKTRLQANDSMAIEYAICFLEVRPYFFRSGYMYKDLLRWCRMADLTTEQRVRFDAVVSAYKKWRTQSRTRREP